MKKKLLMLMCACLLLGACSTSTPENQEAVTDEPQAVALTFTEQEQEIARMSSTELVGIEFQNYNQGSVFVWAIDEGRVVQEYLIPQYLSEANPMNKMLVGLHLHQADIGICDVSTALYNEAEDGSVLGYAGSMVEADQAWGEDIFDETGITFHLYQPERIALDGRYHVLAAVWSTKGNSEIDEASVFVIDPEEDLTAFLERVSQHMDFAYVVMTEVGAVSP